MLLSRVISLDELFVAPPSDMADKRRRDEVVWYDIIPPSLLTADSLLVSSRASRDICSCCLRTRGCHGLSITLDTMRMFPGFLRICGRLSSVTRSVCKNDDSSLLTGTADGATNEN